MKILWIDDEIEILKPHILFLEKKGYEIESANNASEGIERIVNQSYDAILLDENMPGIGGLDALMRIKEIRPNVPVIMITKNEEEHIMEEAIGRQISDYILKPVNPNQVILSLKKILQSDQIIEEKTIVNYQQEFRKIALDLMDVRTYEDWVNLYNKLISWDIRLNKINEPDLQQILNTQIEEANALFSKFIEKEYVHWLKNDGDGPILSQDLVKEYVKPVLEKNKKVLFLVIDNLRLDQWKEIAPLFNKFFKQNSEKNYFSILPTATQYARNSLFAGMTPLEISKQYPDQWKDDVDEGNKNENEHFFFQEQLKKMGLGDRSTEYIKILNSDFENKIYEEYSRYKGKDIVTIVYNFIDILSHAKTNNKIISELIRDDKTYRSITHTWFENSSLLKIISLAADEGRTVVLTTDHGTQLIDKPSKVVGDKETTTNLRYKQGRNLQYNGSDVIAAENPEEYQLPKVNISSKYIFAKGNVFLAYPNNYNHYVNYYKNTYQHGGVSLQEMIIPFVVLEP